jgi:indolepyruvate decarboxylase
MNLTEYLFHRLRELGVGHTFGIPGDFVLPVYAVQEQVGLPTIVCAHEPGIGFAADAYARLKGLGVGLVTYGPGALNTINPVACAYAEQSPVLIVSGGPEMSLRRPDLHLHHTVKTYESQIQIYREVTIDAAILDDPATAPSAIDRVLRRVVSRKRPGYLEIPRDRVSAPVLPPAGPLEPDPTPAEQAALDETLDEAVREIAAMLAVAERPVLYVGVGVRRHGLTDAVVGLAEKLRLPVATDVLGKASFPESHPQFAGVYLGGLSHPETRTLLDESDFVLGLGVVLTDLGTGFWTGRIAPRTRVLVDPDSVRIRHHRYDGLPIDAVVHALLERLPASNRPAPRFDSGSPERLLAAEPPPVAASESENASVIRVSDLIASLRRLDQARYSFVTDVGDSWFIGLELRADVFLAAGYYASMGFAVPGALGAGVADLSRRPFAIVGDGAFQMTGTELATMVDEGLKPIILLVNNACYGMLEAIDRPHRYYERRPWDYPAFARALGAQAERATNATELAAALARAEAANSAYLIEAVTAKEDLSPVMARIRAFAHGQLDRPSAS